MIFERLLQKANSLCYLSDSSSNITFGTRFRTFIDITNTTTANIKNPTVMGLWKKIVGPPMERDWRKDCSNIGPKMKPKISGAIG